MSILSTPAVDTRNVPGAYVIREGGRALVIEPTVWNGEWEGGAKTVIKNIEYRLTKTGQSFVRFRDDKDRDVPRRIGTPLEHMAEVAEAFYGMQQAIAVWKDKYPR